MFSTATQTQHTASDKPLFVAFLCLLVWLPLPFGSNREWAWSLMELGVFSLALLWWRGYSRASFSLPLWISQLRWPLAMLGVVCCWQLFQMLPLPMAVLSVLSPAAAAIHAGVSPDAGWATISLDPYATREALLKSITYSLVFLLTMLLVRDAYRLRLLALTIVFSGLFQAVYGSLMVLSGLEWGFFIKKEVYLDVATGTFINRNHLAGFLELCLATGIGLLIANLNTQALRGWRQHLRHFLSTLLSGKARLRLYLAIMVVALVLTHSRMGNTAFFSSLLIVGVIALLSSRMRRVRRTSRGMDKRSLMSMLVLLASLVVIDIFIVGAWFGFDKVVDRVENTRITTEERDEVNRDSLTMLQDYWLTGSGAGSYYSTFPSYRGNDIRSFYDYAHNDYLQFATESGLPVVLCLAAFVFLSVYSSVVALIRRRSASMRGYAFASLMAVIALMIHSSVDFNLHIPANAAYFMLLAAMGYNARFVDTKH